MPTKNVNVSHGIGGGHYVHLVNQPCSRVEE